MIHRLLCLALLSVLSLPSQAAMVYMDRLPFEATLGVSVTDGYDRGDYTKVAPIETYNNADMSAVLGETSYTSTSLVESNYVPTRLSDGETYYCSGCNGSFLLDFTQTTTFGSGNPVYGVGFDVFFYGANISNVWAFVTFGDDTTENYLLPEANPNVSPFWGLTDSLLIKSIHLGGIDGVSSTQEMALDNLTIGSMRDMSVIPVPAAFWLFASALAGLAGLRLRATRDTA